MMAWFFEQGITQTAKLQGGDRPGGFRQPVIKYRYDSRPATAFNVAASCAGA